jgi:hypothetical protein
LTTQHRNVIYVVTPVRLRGRRIGEAQVQIVNPWPPSFSASSRSTCSGTKS